MFATAVTRMPKDGGRQADAIVVLTGERERISEAARLLRSGRAEKLLISGVNRKTGRKALQRISKIGDRLFTCCVTVGYQAQNTRGNAQETEAWLREHNFSSLIVVTAHYHMPRSLKELALRLPDVELIAHPVLPRGYRDKPWWLHFNHARTLVQEYLKFLPASANYVMSRLVGPRSSAGEPGRQQNMQAGSRG